MHDNSPSATAKVWREDLVSASLSALVVAGLYLDGWSHLNLYGGRLGSFFTPWHGLLYSAFSCNVAWVVACNRHLWHPEMTPPDALFRIGKYRLRYPYALFGLAIATVGMTGDIAWHAALGEEVGVARVIAPFHVVLVLGAALLVMAPLRSAVHAPGLFPPTASVPAVFPAVVALALAAALSSFVVQWISPFIDWPQAGFRISQPSMAAAVVIASFTLGLPVLLAIRYWPGAFGAATVITGVAGFALVTLGSYKVGWTLLSVVVGGAATDVAARVGRRLPANGRLYLAASVFPIVTWTGYFGVLRVAYGGHWPGDFALGVAAFSVLALCTMTFVLTLPGTS